VFDWLVACIWTLTCVRALPTLHTTGDLMSLLDCDGVKVKASDVIAISSSTIVPSPVITQTQTLKFQYYLRVCCISVSCNGLQNSKCLILHHFLLKN
jgi:hypothetical protein